MIPRRPPSSSRSRGGALFTHLVLPALLLAGPGATAMAQDLPQTRTELRQEIQTAQRFLRQGRLAQALTLYQDLYRAFPDDASVARAYAGALRQTGRYQEALDIYAAADARVGHPRFLLDRVALLKQLDQRRQALDLCLQELDSMGSIRQYVHDEVVELSADPDLWDRAHDLLQDRFEDAPTEATGETLIELRLRRGRDEAAVDAARVLDRTLDGGGIRLYQLARRLERQGKVTLARDLVDEVVVAYPGAGHWREAVLFRADLDVALREPEKALAGLDRARTEIPRPQDRYPVDVRRAEILSASLGRAPEAVAIYDEMLAEPLLRSRHEEVRLERAETQMRVGLVEGALDDFRTLAATSRREATRERAEHLVGELYFYAGNIDSAAAAYLRQVEAHPAGTYANDALERIFLFNENYEGGGEALSALGKVHRVAALGDEREATRMGLELVASQDGTAIHDDLLWTMGGLLAGSDAPVLALSLLDELATRYPESRLAPRALQLLAALREERVPVFVPLSTHLPLGGYFGYDKARALATYEELLIRYPLSIEASEVRQKVSQLRKELPS
jgi:tetratricopeptide (TPR) repeat protein